MGCLERSGFAAGSLCGSTSGICSDVCRPLVVNASGSDNSSTILPDERAIKTASVLLALLGQVIRIGDIPSWINIERGFLAKKIISTGSPPA
jgi:hypothetical protein